MALLVSIRPPGAPEGNNSLLFTRYYGKSARQEQSTRHFLFPSPLARPGCPSLALRASFGGWGVRELPRGIVAARDRSKSGRGADYPFLPFLPRFRIEAWIRARCH